jgi:hypothetical protein
MRQRRRQVRTGSLVTIDKVIVGIGEVGDDDVCTQCCSTRPLRQGARQLPLQRL